MFSILTFMGLYLIPKHHNLMLIATMKLVKESETRTRTNSAFKIKVTKDFFKQMILQVCGLSLFKVMRTEWPNFAQVTVW